MITKLQDTHVLTGFHSCHERIFFTGNDDDGNYINAAQ